MIEPGHISRFEVAVRSQDPRSELYALAVSLRAEGVTQIDTYLLFAHFQEATDGDDPRYDAIVDNMDLIWGGPWAKGHGLFPTELTNDEIRRHERPPLGQIPP